MRQKQPLQAEVPAKVTEVATEEVVPQPAKAEPKATVKPTQKSTVTKMPSGNTIEDF